MILPKTTRPLILGLSLLCSALNADEESIKQPSAEEATVLSHPALFISQEEADQIVAKAETDDFYRHALDTGILANAQAAYEELQPKLGHLPRKESTHPHQNTIYAARDLALGSLFTNDPAYARLAADILLEYASFYPTLPQRKSRTGKLTAQTLNEAMMMVQFSWIYDMLYPTLSEDERRSIEDNLLREGAKMLLPKEGRTNWQSWHNTALATLGLVLDEPSYLEQANNGPWGFHAQMESSANPDGLWYEMSISYQDYTMQALTLQAIACQRAGIPLFQADNSQMRALYLAPLYFAYSNLYQAPFHDAHPAARLDGGATAWQYPYAWQQYQDPAMLWLWQVKDVVIERANREKRMPPLVAQSVIDFYPGSPADKTPKAFSIGTDQRESGQLRNVLGSTLFNNSGVAVMRGPAAETSAEMAMIWKPRGTEAGHQHPNNLAIDWQSAGHRWLSASGKWEGYSSRLHKDWVAQTLSDNTLVVDGESQRPSGKGIPNWKYDGEGETSAGQLIAFTNGLTFGYVQAETDNVYPGVLLARQLIHTDAYTLDFFTTLADEVHTYDWSLNITGSLQSASAEFSPAQAPFTQRGVAYTYLSDTQSLSAETPVTTLWTDADTSETLAITTLPQLETELYVSTTPWKSRERGSLILSRSDMDAAFLNLWRAYEGTDPIADVRQIKDGYSLVVELISGQTDTIDLGFDGMLLDGSVGEDIVYRARAFMLRQNEAGELLSATAISGNHLRTPALELNFAQPANWSLHALPDGSYLLTFDHAETVEFTLQSEKSYSIQSLDNQGTTTGTLKSQATQSWQLQPFTNYLLSPEGQSPVSLPQLVKTFRTE